MDIENIVYTNIKLQNVEDTVTGYFEVSGLTDYGTIAEAATATIDWGSIV